MIRCIFYLKCIPHTKKKTQFSLYYFSSAVRAQEWVTGEAQLGPLELHLWKREGEKLARLQQQSFHLSHNPPQPTHHNLVHFRVLVVKHKWGLGHISAWWLIHRPQFFTNSNTILATEKKNNTHLFDTIKKQHVIGWYSAESGISYLLILN